MFRVLTVTLNPALDEVYEVPDFSVGRLNRPVRKTTTAGGKGINVARAYRALGGDVCATGLAGGRIGADILATAQGEGIPTAFINVASESRVCIKIADPVTGSQTELNESGGPVSHDEYAALLARVRELLPAYDVIVLSGSVPPGLPETVYADLIHIAQDEYAVPAFLDASGAPLLAGIAARPRFVKPNLDEARSLGIVVDFWEHAADAIRDRFAVSVALVTAGANGAVLSTDDGRWIAKPPSVTVKSAVGSGDSLTAGFLSAWEDGGAVTALRLGVAAGAVNATELRSGEISRSAVLKMAHSVVVDTLA